MRAIWQAQGRVSGEGAESDADRRIRQRWIALWHGRGSPSRPRLPALCRRLLFPHRAVRRRKDLAPQIALPRAAADPGPDLAVRRRADRCRARCPAGLPQAHRGGVLHGVESTAGSPRLPRSNGEGSTWERQSHGSHRWHCDQGFMGTPGESVSPAPSQSSISVIRVIAVPPFEPVQPPLPARGAA